MSDFKSPRGYVHTHNPDISPPVHEGCVPVLVLDLNDEAEIRRLHNLIFDLGDVPKPAPGSGISQRDKLGFHTTTVALRKFAGAQARPEPTGIGVVVMERDGDTWVSAFGGLGSRRWHGTNGRTATWDVLQLRQDTGWLRSNGVPS